MNTPIKHFHKGTVEQCGCQSTKHTPGPCECRVQENYISGIPQRPYIVYCPTHAAAPDMLEALNQALCWLEDPNSADNPADAIAAAIAKAEGKE